MKPILIFLFLLVSASTLGQDFACFEFNEQARISSNTGLNLRAEPNNNSEVLAKIPFWHLVDLCGLAYVTDTINGVKGNWTKVRYGESKGYVFDAYLVPIDSSHALEKDFRIMQEQASCSAINYDPSLFWYGVYRFTKYDTIIPVEIEFERNHVDSDPREEIGGVRTQYSDSLFSYLLIGFRDSIEVNSVFNGGISQKTLYPGQRISVWAHTDKCEVTDKTAVDLIALGNVEDVQYCPIITGYDLRLRNRWGETLTQGLMESVSYAGECGMPAIYWFGDLDGDKRPDLVLMGATNSRYDLYLFLSTQAKENELVGLVDKWTACNCH